MNRSVDTGVGLAVSKKKNVCHPRQESKHVHCVVQLHIDRLIPVILKPKERLAEHFAAGRNRTEFFSLRTASVLISLNSTFWNISLEGVL
jgi:hypothetical protein